MKWISVKDRLPEKENSVLITNGVWVNFGWIESCWYNHEKDEFEETWVGANLDWDGGADKVDVTYWMPNPEPPSDKKDKQERNNPRAIINVTPSEGAISTRG